MRDRVEFVGGWDSAATLVDGQWVERTPRRPEVAEWLRRETRLMPWLAPRLPLRVPEPSVVCEDPLVVRHTLVVGEPAEEPTAAHGRALGGFLRALHDVDVTRAVEHGLRDAATVLGERSATLGRLGDLVVPLLPVIRHAAARSLLDAVRAAPADTVVHGDLGPEHLLVHQGTVSGLIDWSDAHVGDAALDLSWALHGTPARFAAAVRRRYGVTAELRRRSLLWHRLAPWYEVVHGLDTGQPELVDSGLDGVLRRL